jgi:hypothetical protein
VITSHIRAEHSVWIGIEGVHKNSWHNHLCWHRECLWSRWNMSYGTVFIEGKMMFILCGWSLPSYVICNWKIHSFVVSTCFIMIHCMCLQSCFSSTAWTLQSQVFNEYANCLEIRKCFAFSSQSVVMLSVILTINNNSFPQQH